jgi:O-antigen/teichoic acid export membrane protein
MTASAGVVRNVSTSYALRALRALSVLALTPYLFRRLGLDGFGTWSVLFTVATVFSLGEYGATQGVTKHVSAHRDDPELLRELLAAAMTFMLVLGVLALGGSALLAVAGGTLAAPGFEHEFQAGLVLIGAAMIVRFPGQVCGAALMGAQRYDLFNLAEAVTVIGFMAGAVAVVELGGGILALAAAYSTSMVIGALAFVAMLRRVDPRLVVGPRRVAARHRRAVSRFGGVTLLVDTMDFIAMRMDTLIVAALRGAASASPVAAGARVTGGVQALILPFVSVLLPMVSELHARGDREGIRRRLLVATRIAVQITVVTAGALALFADDLVRAWLGPAAPPVTADIVVLLMLVQIAILAATPASKVLLGLGRLRALRWLAIAEGAGNLALSLVLVWRLGAIGAALGTLASSALLVPARIPLACRYTGCALRRLAREALLPAARGAAPALALMLVVRMTLEPGAARLAAGLVTGAAAALLAGAGQLGPGRLLRAVRRPDPRPTVAEAGG